MNYFLIAILFALFGLEYSRRKRIENNMFDFLTNRINSMENEMRNNEKASKNSYRKLVLDLEQTNSRISGQSLTVSSLKRGLHFSGGFVVSESSDPTSLAEES